MAAKAERVSVTTDTVGDDLVGTPPQQLAEDVGVLAQALTEMERSRGSYVSTNPGRITGIVIGNLVELTTGGRPLVDFPANPMRQPVTAISTLAFSADDVGRQLALAFENGDPQKPIILGLIQLPHSSIESAGHPAGADKQDLNASVDGETITLTAQKEIVLRCGQASITLTRAGKVLIRGAYLLSRSSGVNRIKGGSVQIN